MIDNPEYEKELAQLIRKRKLATIFISILFILIFALLLLLLGSEGSCFCMSIAVIASVFVLFVNEQYEQNRLMLMFKHGILDKHWKDESENELNNMAAQIAAELNTKKRTVEIIVDDDNTLLSKSSQIFEARLSRKLTLPIETFQQLDRKQLEFLLATAISGSRWNSYSDKYVFVLLLSPYAIGLAILPTLPLDIMWIINLLLMAISFGALLCIPSKRKKADNYTKILSITKNYEAAKSALLFESKSIIKKMRPKMLEILMRENKHNDLSQEETELHITETDKKLVKLKEAAQELGLID